MADQAPLQHLHTFPCAQCGANLAYRPGTAELECPYCGFRQPVPTTEELIEVRAADAELDLVQALRSLPDSEVWTDTGQTVQCQTCGAVTAFADAQTAGRCVFCGSPQVIPQTSVERRIRPASLVPFTLDDGAARTRYTAWLGSGWFRPNDLQKVARLDKLVGIYIPFWTFDAHSEARWSADAGYYYYTTEQYRDGNGNTQTRQVQHVRWVPTGGHRADDFDDTLVGASHGLPRPLLDQVAPFDTTALVPYQAHYLAGFQAEAYQVDLPAAWQIGEAQIRGEIERRCSGDVPGDTQRNLRVQANLSDLTFKHVLLPVYVCAYRYGDKVYRAAVNGQTGSVTGEAPLSWVKITLAVLLGLAILALVLYFRQNAN